LLPPGRDSRAASDDHPAYKTGFAQRWPQSFVPLCAVAVGLAAGWLASGGLAVLAIPAAVVAVLTGYAKAYSP
jgi:hypothetical protein